MGAQGHNRVHFPVAPSSLSWLSSEDIMGGHQRLWHPKWWSRYVWGYFATMQIACFASEQQYGIDRSKTPDQLWPWWNEIIQKKRRGEIPADTPGYMLTAYQNESEQRWAAAREAAAEAAHEE